MGLFTCLFCASENAVIRKICTAATRVNNHTRENSVLITSNPAELRTTGSFATTWSKNSVTRVRVANFQCGTNSRCRSNWNTLTGTRKTTLCGIAVFFVRTVTHKPRLTKPKTSETVVIHAANDIKMASLSNWCPD